MAEQSLNSNDEPSGTLFVKDIDRIDCSLFDPSTGILGQSWYVDVEITGQLDENGFVYDFSHLKKLVKTVLKNSLDHALLIPIKSTHVHYQETEQGEYWRLSAKTRKSGVNANWEYKCPKGAVYPVRAVKVSVEALEVECAKLIRHRLPATIQKVAVSLRQEEGDNNPSFFRYTHGITKHDGLCQRLFHGHRSLIEVSVAGERRQDLEQYIAHDVFGSIIHIASLNQVIEGPDSITSLTERSQSDELVKLGYEGSLGRYEATMPISRIFFVEQETSIECIAQELASILAKETNENGTIQVRCYEGIDKGAMAEL